MKFIGLKSEEMKYLKVNTHLSRTMKKIQTLQEGSNTCEDAWILIKKNFPLKFSPNNSIAVEQILCCYSVDCGPIGEAVGDL